jgi:hypothetical protein
MEDRSERYVPIVFSSVDCDETNESQVKLTTDTLNALIEVLEEKLHAPETAEEFATLIDSGEHQVATELVFEQTKDAVLSELVKDWDIKILKHASMNGECQGVDIDAAADLGRGGQGAHDPDAFTSTPPWFQVRFINRDEGEDFVSDETISEGLECFPGFEEDDGPIEYNVLVSQTEDVDSYLAFQK